MHPKSTVTLSSDEERDSDSSGMPINNANTINSQTKTKKGRLDLLKDTRIKSSSLQGGKSPEVLLLLTPETPRTPLESPSQTKNIPHAVEIIDISDDDEDRTSEAHLARALENGTMNEEEAELVRSITRGDNPKPPDEQNDIEELSHDEIQELLRSVGQDLGEGVQELLSNQHNDEPDSTGQYMDNEGGNIGTDNNDLERDSESIQEVNPKGTESSQENDSYNVHNPQDNSWSLADSAYKRDANEPPKVLYLSREYRPARNNYRRTEISRYVPPSINSTNSPIQLSDEDVEMEDASDTYNNSEQQQEEEEEVEAEDPEDDIVVLDSSQAQNYKFKPTSFELQRNYNAPAPVYHVQDTNDASRVAFTQLQQRVGALQSELNAVVMSNQKLSQQGHKMNADYSTLARSHRQLVQQRAHLDPESSGLLCSQLDSVISRRAGELHTHTQKMNHYSEIYKSNQMHMIRLQQSIELYKNQLRTFGLDYDAASLNSNLSFHQFHDNIRSQQMQLQQQGYRPNIYSAVASVRLEQADLKDLIDNIQEEDSDEQGLEATPPELTVNLMKHQRIGLQWLIRMEKSKSKGGILADDMGLGKTIQTIALFMANRSTDEKCKTNLIIAPVSLLRQWAAELESKLKSTVPCKIGIYHSTDKKALGTFAKMLLYDVILTSYGTLSSEWKRHFREAILKEKEQKNNESSATIMPRFEDGGKEYVSPFFLKSLTFYRIILDEAQNIKNKAALASKAVTYLKGEYRFCLSGTPIQNNVEELFPIVRFLQIRPYNDEVRFRADISLPLKSNSGNYDTTDKQMSLNKVRAILKAILLRRSKTSLIDGKPILSLPEKHVLPEFVEMGTEEKSYYGGLEVGIQNKAKSLMGEAAKKNGGMGNTTSSILTLLLRLRQACCHLYLVEIGESKKTDDEPQKKKNWQNMYVQLKKLDSTVLDRLKETDMFTCPMCYNLVKDSVVIFPKCGHVICLTCVDTFVQERVLDDDSVLCIECQTPFKLKDMIDYEMFVKVHLEELGYEAISAYFHAKYARPVLKVTNEQLLRQILEKEKYQPLAKIIKCVETIQEILAKSPDEKIIVFSQFTTLFDIMKLSLDKHEIPFLRYDGSMSLDRKNQTIKKFYQEDTRVLLLSLKAGNSGLTLTCASHVVLMDPFWNPFVEEQAMDRAHRIGQEREVYVHKILINGTVESRIMELQEHKKRLVGEALDENGMKNVSSLKKSELGFLFGLNQLD